MRVLCVTGESDRPETETFIGLKNKGVDLEVMCPTSAPYYSYLINSGLKVTSLKLKARIDMHAIRRIRSHLKEKKPDILHGFNNKAVSNGLLASNGLPIKIVAYRGIVGNVSFFNPVSWLTYLHPKVKRVICVAHAVRKYFLDMRFLGLHLSPRKFVTIYKGHSLDWYKEPLADLGEFSIPKNSFVVGCIANYRPRKGIQVLVDSAQYLPQDKSIHFLLVGNMHSARLDNQVRHSPFKNCIHLTGYRRDAPALMAACDACVLPALKREGLPKSVIEAMAYAVSPIVTDSGGSPELIVHKKSGLIVPSGNAKAIADAIIYLYKNPDVRRKMGDNARERIRTHFRIDDTITKTFNLYNELLSEATEP